MATDKKSTSTKRRSSDPQATTKHSPLQLVLSYHHGNIATTFDEETLQRLVDLTGPFHLYTVVPDASEDYVTCSDRKGHEALLKLQAFDGRKLIVTTSQRVATKRQKKRGTATPDQLNADANNAVDNNATTPASVDTTHDQPTNMDTEENLTLYIKRKPGKDHNVVNIATDKPTALKRELDANYIRTVRRLRTPLQKPVSTNQSHTIQ